MKVAVFSDVHGNLPALQRFLQATKDTVDSYLCLGDVVNYGPWNDECLEMICQLPGITLLEGNHERLFQGLDDVNQESSPAGDSKRPRVAARWPVANFARGCW